MEPRLKEVILSLTNRCNLKCSMCHLPRLATPELSTQQWKDLILDACALHTGSIVFSGGEPLLRSDIYELIAFANKNKLNTCLTSNGTMITGEVSSKLLAAGIGVVNVSIDGPQDIHDRLRGKGNFQKSLAALKNLRESRIETTIATIVCRENYKFLSPVMELANRTGVTTVKFQPFSTIFLVDAGAADDFFVPKDDFNLIERAIEELISLSRRYKISTNPEGYLRSIPYYLCRFRQMRSSIDCAAVWNSCPISCEGKVHLCWVLSDMTLGTITQAKLSKLWNSVEHNRLRDIAKNERCSGCLMSCYDYNLGKYRLIDMFAAKFKKFKKPAFYKRQYFKFHQHVRYLFKKFLNRALSKSAASGDQNSILQEIEEIKSMFSNKLKEYEKT